MADPWNLMETKQYEAAVREYTRLYRKEKSDLWLNNRGLAYLLMGDHAASLADYQHGIQANPSESRSTHPFIYAGICLWYLNRPDEAIPTWRAGLTAPYADAAGGVELPALLLYGGIRLEMSALMKEATRLLKKHWSKYLRRQKQRQERSRPTSHAAFVHPGLVAWPGAIVPLLLGELDVGRFREAADGTTSDILRQRQRCAADFYVGVHAALQSDVPTFEQSMRRCASSERGLLEHEYFLARWEVERGFPRPAFD